MGTVTAFPRSDETALARQLLQRLLDTGHVENVDGASGDVIVSFKIEGWRFEQLCTLGAEAFDLEDSDDDEDLVPVNSNV